MKKTIYIGGCHYYRQALYGELESECTILRCYGSAEQNCNIRLWTGHELTVGTDELHLTEYKRTLNNNKITKQNT